MQLTFLFNNTQLVKFSQFISLKLSCLILTPSFTKVLSLLDLPESLFKSPFFLKVIDFDKLRPWNVQTNDAVSSNWNKLAPYGLLLNSIKKYLVIFKFCKCYTIVFIIGRIAITFLFNQCRLAKWCEGPLYNI